MDMQNTEIIFFLDSDKTNTVKHPLAMKSVGLSQSSQKSMERISLTRLDLNSILLLAEKGMKSLG